MQNSATAIKAEPLTEQRVWLMQIGAHLLSLGPLAWMLWQLYDGQIAGDVVAILTHRTGWWALSFLLLSLAMTPLRHLTGSPIWNKFRRMLGLWAFALASLHLGIYLALDLQQDWQNIFSDVLKRPYISVGFSAWLMMIPLALTSNRLAMRALGGRWKKLHKSVYLIAVFAVLHFLWLVKKDLMEPSLFAAALAILLIFRVYLAWRLKSQSRSTSNKSRGSGTADKFALK